MDVKEYLDKLENWYELIISNKEEIEYLKELSTYTSYDDLKLKIKELEDSIYEEMEQYIDLLKNIRKKINKLKDVNEKLYLKYKYILHYSNKQILEMNIISDNTISRVHRKALEHMNKILNKEEFICLDK